MNKYRKLLGSQRGGHFRESKKKFKFSSRRRQSVRFRGRYAKSVAQKAGTTLWMAAKFILVIAVVAWIAGMGMHLYHQSTFFRVQSVIFEGEVPDELRAFLPLKPGQGFFSVEPSKWEKEAAGRFPEIKEISISRTLRRNVVVDVRCRVPVAYLSDHNRGTGIDAEGEIFPVHETGEPAVEILPTMKTAPLAQRLMMAQLLLSWKRESPDFYALVEEIGTDQGDLETRLRGGIQLNWGSIDEKNMIDKAKNILRLMDQYTPIKGPAKLAFVTDDRIVMDSNWTHAASK